MKFLCSVATESEHSLGVMSVISTVKTVADGLSLLIVASPLTWDVLETHCSVLGNNLLVSTPRPSTARGLIESGSYLILSCFPQPRAIRPIFGINMRHFLTTYNKKIVHSVP